MYYMQEHYNLSCHVFALNPSIDNNFINTLIYLFIYLFIYLLCK